MPDIEAPDINELYQLCDFAETRLEQIAGATDFDDGGNDDPPSEWEWGCLNKTRAWLKQLKEITPEQEIDMAMAVLKKYRESHGVMVVLDLSTDHLSQETKLAWLDGKLEPYLTYRYDDTGWWLWTCVGEPELEKVPEDLQTIIRKASELGYEWIRFDKYSPRAHGFPVYE